MSHQMQTILIIDDTRLNVNIMTNILSEDYNILSATSGKEAFHIISSHAIDLILLDIFMPEMDGYEVCKRLKRKPETQNIPIIFVSAMTDSAYETKGLELGAIDYIHKPVNAATLKGRVKKQLELKRNKDLLEQYSLMDALTGIANRRNFDETLNKEWRRALRSGDTLSLLLFDIDYFKKYNDHYGHQAGDHCLTQVGLTLKNSVKRAGDLVARYGGEEFVVILPSTTSDEATIVAERIRISIETQNIPHNKSDITDHVTVSIGIATVIPSENINSQHLITLADKALYISKRNGRNQATIAITH